MLALTVIASWLACPTAQAQVPEPHEQAVDLNDEGERLFEKGQYAEAASRFEAGYAMEPNPTFLYNLALAREKNGEFEKALDALSRYREADPNAPDDVAIDARIQTLRELVVKIKAEKNRPPRPEPVAPKVRIEREPSVLDGYLPWVIAGVGSAGLVVGGVLGGLALKRQDDAVAEPVHAAALDLQAGAERLATGSTIAWVAGGVLAAVGLTLAIVGALSDEGKDEEGMSTLTLRLNPGGLTVGGTF